MPIPRIILVLCLVCCVCFGAHGQQTVPPPPKPASDSPNLEDTMKFVQDKLNDLRRLRFTVSWRDDASGDDYGFEAIDELTTVVADPRGCTLSYRLRAEATNTTPLVSDFVLRFKEVSKITVEPVEVVLGPGHRVLPPVWQVWIFQAEKVRGYFRTDDEELANRLARAITHAVELCSADKKPEPF